MRNLSRSLTRVVLQVQNFFLDFAEIYRGLVAEVP
jgi:hypothetical protein